MTHARETDVYWLKISNTVDEIVACLEGVGSDDLDWSPSTMPTASTSWPLTRWATYGTTS